MLGLLILFNSFHCSLAYLNHSTIRFYLNQENGNMQDISTFNKKSNLFVNDSEIVIIIHGYTEKSSSEWIKHLAKAYSTRTDKTYQIIVTEWGYEATPYYYYVTRNIKNIGVFIAKWMIQLARTEGFNISRYHMVTFSLGAHIAGFAGRYIKRNGHQPLHRITALDAAGPGFYYKGPTYRLTKHDAEVVVGIHTDGGWFGFSEPIGHVDLYPNGGTHSQPGCRPTLMHFLFESCSHARSRELWKEGIMKNYFYGTLCSSWRIYTRGLCHGNKKLNFAGDMYSITQNDSGVYYTMTNRKKPFIRTKTMRR